MKITKSFHFHAAHRLTFHKGGCKNLHGHTYKLEITIEDPSFKTENCIIYDFAKLKSMIKISVLGNLDHSLLIYKNDKFLNNMLEHLRKHNMKTQTFGYETTVENLCICIFNRLKEYLPYTLKKVRLWETPTAYAEYEGKQK